MKLWRARVDFTLALSRLIQYANDHLPQFNVALGEGYVALTDGRDGDHDGPHRKDGGHYTGLAVDLIVYDQMGTYISDGTHPAYKALGEQWERLDSQARWGGRFASKDGNHFSFVWNGVA